MTVFLTTTVFQTAIYTFIIIRNVYFNVIFRKDPSFLHHFYQNYSHRTFSVIPFNSHTSHYTNIHTFYFLTMISNPPYHTGTPKIISVPHIRQTSFLSPYSPPFSPQLHLYFVSTPTSYDTNAPVPKLFSLSIHRLYITIPHPLQSQVQTAITTTLYYKDSNITCSCLDSCPACKHILHLCSLCGLCPSDGIIIVNIQVLVDQLRNISPIRQLSILTNTLCCRFITESCRTQTRQSIFICNHCNLLSRVHPVNTPPACPHCCLNWKPFRAHHRQDFLNFYHLFNHPSVVLDHHPPLSSPFQNPPPLF